MWSRARCRHLYLLAEVEAADSGLVKVITHSSISPARNTGPRPSLATTSIMAGTAPLRTCHRELGTRGEGKKEKNGWGGAMEQKG